jgi:hypothetical protein
VQRVEVLPERLELGTGDITPVGVKVVGQGARTVPGRVVTISSDNPSVAYVDASGRVRAVSPGSTIVRATADGVVGTARVDVLAENAIFALRTSSGVRLPHLVDSDSVTWHGVRELHELWMESGTMELSGAARPRYELEIRYAEYNVRIVDGRRVLELRTLPRVRSRQRRLRCTRRPAADVRGHLAPVAHRERDQRRVSGALSHSRCG